MIDITNVITGILIVLLNLIPIILKKTKYLKVTIPLSLLIGAIKVLFL